MKAGEKVCPKCSTRYTFANYLAARIERHVPICLGCSLYIPILEEAADRATVDDMPAAEPEPIHVQIDAFMERLRAGHGAKVLPFDSRMAAAGRDDG